METYGLSHALTLLQFHLHLCFNVSHLPRRSGVAIAVSVYEEEKKKREKINSGYFNMSVISEVVVPFLYFI